jgi:uncharacterized protein
MKNRGTNAYQENGLVTPSQRSWRFRWSEMSGVSDAVLKSWMRAAESGSAAAAFNLGLHYDERKELARAKAWYTVSMNGGDVDAAINLGLLYVNEGDFRAAEPCLRIGVGEGRPVAMHMLGVILSQSEQWDEVAQLWEGAARLGHQVAARKRGFLALYLGEYEKAEIYLRQAAVAGDEDAISLLVGHLRAMGRVEEAARWSERLRS